MSDDKQDDPTATQPRPNISTEHQRDGDARKPSDTLDREQDDREPAGDNPPEPVENRPNVGTVIPDDYPSQQ